MKKALTYMTLERLELDQIEACMKNLNQWQHVASESCITKEWRFANFKTAIAMLVKVSELADRHNHHPEMVSAYTALRIKLWTHDVQGLSTKDFELAQAIDNLVAQAF
jgi:4a-hydroxytetrahydrobiopterin dehydratase